MLQALWDHAARSGRKSENPTTVRNLEAGQHRARWPLSILRDHRDNPAPLCAHPETRVAPLYGASVARYVIDAPTLLHLVTENVDISSSHQLVAPNLIRSQALSLLLAAVRGGEITEEVALRRHERLTEIKMRLLGDRVSRRTAWKIARENGWDTTFDAEYLAVCRLQADALITIDQALAGKAADIVPLANVAALVADLPHRRDG
jgi:predicted nucleic acid-binding protein